MTWRIAETLETLRRQLNAAYPNRSKASDGGIGDAGHASRSADHNPYIKDAKGVGIVTARDFTHDPINGLDCHKLAEWLVESRDPRIKYIIWNRQICSSKQQPWKWRPYNGINAHRHHLHLSVDADPRLYDSTKPWDLDIAQTTLTAGRVAPIMENSAVVPPELLAKDDSSFTDSPAVVDTISVNYQTAQPPIQKAEAIVNVGQDPPITEDQPFAQYIPNISKEKILFGGGIVGTALANIVAWFGNLSLFAQIMLTVVLILIVGGFIWFLVANRKFINQFILEAIRLKADKTKNSPVLTTEKPTEAEQTPNGFTG